MDTFFKFINAFPMPLWLAMMFAPLLSFLDGNMMILSVGGQDITENKWLIPFVMVAGFGVLLLTMHVARWIGRLHGQIAKRLLVKI